jgi:quinol monooxygenase YgiN
MTIRHVVMWKLRDPADAPNFKALLDSCAGVVPGVLQFEVGIRSADHEASLDVVLVSLFASPEALNAYQQHPHHKSVSARLGPLREQRYVLDYEV